MKRCRQRWTRTATCTPTSRWRQPDSLTALCREPLATKIAANVANLQPLKKKNPEKRCITNAFQDSENTKYLFPLAPVRCFLNRFAYRISLRVLTFFSLFRQQGLSDFLLPWCCHIIGVNLLSLILVGRSECHSYTRLISYFLFNDIYYNPWTIS